MQPLGRCIRKTPDLLKPGRIALQRQVHRRQPQSVLSRNALRRTRGDAAGAKLATDPVDRYAVKT